MATNLGDLLKNLGLSETKSKTEEGKPAPSTEPSLSFAGKVVVRVTKRGRGGKTVTELQGVLGDLAGYAKTLRKGLGVGAKPEGELIIVQGDQRDRLIPMLEAAGAKKVVRS